jgi:hypothetical protein
MVGVLRAERCLGGCVEGAEQHVGRGVAASDTNHPLGSRQQASREDHDETGGGEQLLHGFMFSRRQL